jgi:hypothetical protein
MYKVKGESQGSSLHVVFIFYETTCNRSEVVALGLGRPTAETLELLSNCIRNSRPYPQTDDLRLK